MDNRPHPFADLIDLAVAADGKGGSVATLVAEQKHMNPHGVVHGAVVYALADTGMAFVVVTHQAPDHKALLP